MRFVGRKEINHFPRPGCFTCPYLTLRGAVSYCERYVQATFIEMDGSCEICVQVTLNVKSVTQHSAFRRSGNLNGMEKPKRSSTYVLYLGRGCCSRLFRSYDFAWTFFLQLMGNDLCCSKQTEFGIWIVLFQRKVKPPASLDDSAPSSQ